MAALESEGDAQKLRFGPWLVNAVSSGLYQGLYWTDPARSIFRIPWKHNARKDVTSSDIEIFKFCRGVTSSGPKVFKVDGTRDDLKVLKMDEMEKLGAWAKASGRYEGNFEDPAKWKTNFRCALRSTHMFKLLEDHSKCNNDPHKVYAVTSAASQDKGFRVPVADAPLQQQQLQPNHCDAASELVPPAGAGSAAVQAVMQQELDMLQSVLRQCDISAINAPPPSWAPAGDALHEDALLLPGHGSCLLAPAFQEWVSLEEQGGCSHPDPLLLTDQTLPGAVPPPCHPHPGRQEATVPGLSPGEELLFQPSTSPMPPPPPGDTGELPLILDITIYYRGKMVHQEVVGDSRCVLAYDSMDPAVADQRLVAFPSPAGLADGKQRQYTEDLLGVAGLRLEQRAGMLLATRLKKCKVFWALSQQLEDRDPPGNPLQRDQETPIFDFNVFCTELRDFRDRHRERSPDFTIFLCFGQSFNNNKSKESKLILVKLVPKFCEYWYEQVQREGASSLNSGNVSLQLSDSFNLFELIEQYRMQMD